MGSWGAAPWDNDTAADWFYFALQGDTSAAIHGELLKVTDAAAFTDKAYAALWLLSKIGINYVYEIDYLDDDIAKAVEILDRWGESFSERFYTQDARDQVTAWLASIRRDLTDPKPPGLVARLEGMR